MLSGKTYFFHARGAGNETIQNLKVLFRELLCSYTVRRPIALDSRALGRSRTRTESGSLVLRLISWARNP
jgi:hypothetical protein